MYPKSLSHDEIVFWTAYERIREKEAEKIIPSHKRYVPGLVAKVISGQHIDLVA